MRETVRAELKAALRIVMIAPLFGVAVALLVLAFFGTVFVVVRIGQWLVE